MDLFRFDPGKARSAIHDPDGAIWPVNSYSDADELNGLFEAALEADVIAGEAPGAYIHVYSLSISEPDPVLAVVPPRGPALLGYTLKLRDRDDESPVEFTLRLLEETTIDANLLAEQAAVLAKPSSEPSHALQRFIEAAQLLDQAWAPTLHVEGYPSYLPSFDEFALDVASMRFKASP